MSYFNRWDGHDYEEIDEPIVVCFKEKKYDDELPGDPENYTSRFCYTSIEADYESNIGRFRFMLDRGGNVIIYLLSTKCAYVKLPTEVYDFLGTCYPIKRLENVYGREKLKGLYIPEGIEIIGGQFIDCSSPLDIFIPRSMTSFTGIFPDTPPFERNDRGRIWYPGTREEWISLLKNNMKRHVLDLIPYHLYVRYYDLEKVIV